MMLHRRKFVQFIFQMTAINIIDEAGLSTVPWRRRDAGPAGGAHAWCTGENVLRWQLCQNLPGQPALVRHCFCRTRAAGMRPGAPSRRRMSPPRLRRKRIRPASNCRRRLGAGGPDMRPEAVRVLEPGRHAQPAGAVSCAIPLFCRDNDRLRSLAPEAGGALFRMPGYHEPDVRLAWQAQPGVELALAGRNLLHARHPGFGEAGQRQLAERHVFAGATLRF
jgi:hypothetical protein